jgi:hypothetical protein
MEVFLNGRLHFENVSKGLPSLFFFYKNIEFKETEVDGLDIRGIVE